MQLQDFLLVAGNAIEREIKTSLTDLFDNKSPILFDIITDHFGWGDPKGQAGKKIRPMLCLLAANATGVNWRKAIPAASSIEIIHNYSLIHDDIEDQDRVRHGRPTAWVKYGVPQAINAGDALLVSSYSVLKKLGKNYPIELIQKIQQRLTTAIHCLTIGQSLDLTAMSVSDFSIHDYETMIRNKTAILIQESLAVGAILGGMSEEEIMKVGKYGLWMGMAFQVHDDLLGIWGDPSLTGKSSKNDLLFGKKSLPLIFGFTANGEFAQFSKNARITSRNFERAIKLLENDGARKFTIEKEQQYIKHANKEILPLLEKYSGMALVMEFVNSLTNRKI